MTQTVEKTKNMENGSKRPAKELVYDYVRGKILNGEWRGGDFIEEKVVSEAVGVSRTPVREALHRLQGDHYISMTPRRGAVVRQITAQELVEVYESRRLIEIHAMQRICRERLSIPPILRELYEKMCETSKSHDFVQRAEYDQEFHRNIVATINNAVLVELYGSLQVRQQRVAIAAMRVQPSRAETIDQEHHDLIQALENFDEESAIEIISRHLRPVIDVVSRLPV
ncbi:GntR family transcriptional regulator [Thalassospira marina]|uniref:GntR family transcriptional regulator n=2 Tax=Thalassospira marina TaxID=2048283 RepID=A0A2N3KT76_9PROT|nr:GntR family transcriptional regulator [Thalassospira marina]